MARPREFDENAVLDAAVQCFWLHGFEATSVRALAGQMGITSASLYNAFGDKRGLHRRAFEHYVQGSVAARIDRLEGHLPARQALAAFFDDIVSRSLGDPDHKGCMLVNAALEAAPRDPVFRQAVAGSMLRVEAFFHRCIVAGQHTGDISIEQPADDLARLLLGVLLGMRVLARTRPERELLEGLARSALAVLDNHQPVKDRPAHD